MPPKPRNGHDDSSKPETPHSTGKHGHKDGLNGTPASAHHHPHHHAVNGGKMRRVASSAGTNLRESMTAAQLLVAPPDAGLTPASAAGGVSSASAAAPDGTAQEPGAPGAAVQWSSFDRSVLHSYRRVYRLNTPTSFMTDYHRWVLSRPGSMGLQSPTMLRSRVFRRQGKDQLAGAVRKHFNSQGVQENDVIVDFLHKVHTTASGATSKPGRIRRKDAHT
ncbi:hypothetical protein RB595_006467 [Gaeumannomyces hyphopodioides]